MIDIIRREGIYLGYYFIVQMEQILPYWLLGILLGSIISVFGKNRIHRLFESLQNRKLGVFGIVVASIIGIISPLCMYGTIPIAASFSQKGMKDDWLAAFMMSSILLNPQLIIYSGALGGTVVMIRFISCFLCGIGAGLLVRIFWRNKKFFNFTGFAAASNRDIDPNLIIRLLKNMGRNVKATGGYFILGIALTALFQRYVPKNAFVGLFGTHQGLGTLMAATLGVPLYVCGGGTIPLLQQWMALGMSVGSAAAFMITGPATKITNLGAVKIVLGAGKFALYLLYSIGFALLVGILIDLLEIAG